MKWRRRRLAKRRKRAARSLWWMRGLDRVTACDFLRTGSMRAAAYLREVRRYNGDAVADGLLDPSRPRSVENVDPAFIKALIDYSERAERSPWDLWAPPPDIN